MILIITNNSSKIYSNNNKNNHSKAKTRAKVNNNLEIRYNQTIVLLSPNLLTQI